MPEHVRLPNPILFIPNVIFTSPGVPTDGGGIILVVTVDANGTPHIKKVPVDPGPDGFLPAAARMLSALDGVRGLESLVAETAKAIQQQVGRMLEQ
jgi:hypothetical protein